jgi:hypothetical protein
MTELVQTPRQASRPRSRWQDGDTMLSFAVFAVLVFGLLVWRVADPNNWIVVAAAEVEPFQIDVCGRFREGSAKSD